MVNGVAIAGGSWDGPTAQSGWAIISDCVNMSEYPNHADVSEARIATIVGSMAVWDARFGRIDFVGPLFQTALSQKDRFHDT